MKTGNCLIGALLLCHHFKSWKIRVHFNIYCYDFPFFHIFMVDKKGRKWHYKCIDDLFPWPTGIFWFKGKFDRFTAIDRFPNSTRKQCWAKFHDKYLERKKLKFARHWHDLFPGKYCWADCVSWSMDSGQFNPWKMSSAKGCEAESKEHATSTCYCGSWVNGKCWDKLTKSEQEAERLILDAEYEKQKNELPF